MLFSRVQERYEKVMENMQERMEEVETKLRSVRLMLQEKVIQLKDQVSERRTVLSFFTLQMKSRTHWYPFHRNNMLFPYVFEVRSV